MSSSNIDPGDAAYRAWQLTKGDRMAQYGHPWDDYTRVRRIFGSITNYHHNLSTQEAIMFMVCVKLARLMKSLDEGKMHEDSLVDAIGYLNCLHMADAREKLLDAPEGAFVDLPIDPEFVPIDELNRRLWESDDKSTKA